jgi:gas vesicle protein
MGKDSSSHTSAFLMGAVIGGIAGAVCALLLAPKTGQEMREDLNRQADVLRQKGIDVAQYAKEKSEGLAKTVSLQTVQVADKVKRLPEYIRISGKKRSSGSEQ